jgi:hypothetical protein
MSAKGHKLTGVIILCCCSLQAPTVRASDGKPPADAKQLEAWWDDLEKGTIESSRALLGFADHPREALELLRAKLKPLKLDAVRLKAYLLRLGSDNEKLWKQAFEDLSYLDPRLTMGLEPLMKAVPESPARERLAALLTDRSPSLIQGRVRLESSHDGYHFFDGHGRWWVEAKIGRINQLKNHERKTKWSRAVRAVALLEHIGTPEARALLEDMASGHVDAQPTREAKKSLDRLALVSADSEKSAPDDGGKREALWENLEKGAADASRALLALSDGPDQAVTFLRAKLKPLKLDALHLKAYLLRLGSDNEKLWKQAFEDLEYFDPRLAMDLESLMGRVTESPTRERLIALLTYGSPEEIKSRGKTELRRSRQLDSYYFESLGKGSIFVEHDVSRFNGWWWGKERKSKWTRAVRAISLLEHIGTPEARAVLEEMGTGYPDAQPTREARLALERLGARPK